LAPTIPVVGDRIGASRLQHIRHILQVPVAFLFEGAPRVLGTPPDDGNISVIDRR